MLLNLQEKGLARDSHFPQYTSSPADVRSVRGVSAHRTCHFWDSLCYLQSSHVTNPNFPGERGGGLAHGRDFEFVRLSGLVCFS